MTELKNWWLYVLKLEQGKFYVGITSQTPEIRFQEHVKGIRVAYWTKKYKPIKIIDSRNLGRTTKAQAEKYENKVVREYIKKKDANNVRGGDLRDVEDYIIRFKRIFIKEKWEPITLVTLLLLIISILAYITYQ